MKTITITYDRQEIEDGQKFIGETCIDITLLDEVADRLIQTGESGTAIKEIEKAIAPLERLKGKTYIKGSIKDIREYKADI